MPQDLFEPGPSPLEEKDPNPLLDTEMERSEGAGVGAPGLWWPLDRDGSRPSRGSTRKWVLGQRCTCTLQCGEIPPGRHVPPETSAGGKGLGSSCVLCTTLVSLCAPGPVLQPNGDIWRKRQSTLCPSRDKQLLALPVSDLLLQSDKHKATDAQTKVGIIYSSQSWWLIARLPKYEFKKEETLTAAFKVCKKIKKDKRLTGLSQAAGGTKN